LQSWYVIEVAMDLQAMAFVSWLLATVSMVVQSTAELLKRWSLRVDSNHRPAVYETQINVFSQSKNLVHSGQIPKSRLTMLAPSKLHGVAPDVTGLKGDGYKNGYTPWMLRPRLREGYRRTFAAGQRSGDMRLNEQTERDHQSYLQTTAPK
jgi:hypothetical protein